MLHLSHSKDLSFNSRPHTEVDADSTEYDYEPLVFQLTTSHGGRRPLYMYYYSIMFLSTHDLTRRSTSHLCDIL